MPTITFSIARTKDEAGIRRRVIADYNGPASYVTGGDPLTAADVGLGVIEYITLDDGILWNGSAVRLCAYDFTNQKILVYVPNTGAEVAAATDLSAFNARFEAVGY